MEAANISIPVGGEKPRTKETQKGKNPSITRELKQTEERANLQYPVKEMRDHTTEPHTIPTIVIHPTKTASKAKHPEAQKQMKTVT